MPAEGHAWGGKRAGMCGGRYLRRNAQAMASARELTPSLS